MDERSKQFKKILDNIPKKGLIEINKKEKQRVESEYKDFLEHLKQGKCYLCGYSFSHFSIKKPCIHWLLGPHGPKGFKKKKHFPLVYEKFSFHQVDSYFRWLANSEKPFVAISDLKEEKNPSKKIEHTIKYRNLEWSFSSSFNDFTGHIGKQESRVPHYHFQMKVNDFVVIKFGEFHIPFNDYDFFMFSVKNGDFGDRFNYDEGIGSGIQGMISNLKPEEILANLKHSEDEKTAHFKIDTFLEAEPGEIIKGDDINKLLKERDKTGKSFAELSKELKGVKTKIILTPGKGIPEISKRTQRKTKKQNPNADMKN